MLIGHGGSGETGSVVTDEALDDVEVLQAATRLLTGVAMRSLDVIASTRCRSQFGKYRDGSSLRAGRISVRSRPGLADRAHRSVWQLASAAVRVLPPAGPRFRDGGSACPFGKGKGPAHGE
jgi:hypothetical protein